MFAKWQPQSGTAKRKWPTGGSAGSGQEPKKGRWQPVGIWPQAKALKALAKSAQWGGSKVKSQPGPNKQKPLQGSLALGAGAKAKAKPNAKATTWSAKGAKRSKWGKSVAKSSGGRLAWKQQAWTPAKELERHLKAGNLQAAMTAARLAKAKGADASLRKTTPKLLELAAKVAGPLQYGDVMALCIQLKVEIDVKFFAMLLVTLMMRVPVPTGMVRLTLNLAIPKDGQIVSLIPPNATPDEERAVFEDGEPIVEDTDIGNPVSGIVAPASLQVPVKGLGAQAPVQDAEEARDARATLTKVQPESLRGCMKARDHATALYFGHFAALLHIETLIELQALKRRLTRPITDLERFGWTVTGLTVAQVETRQKNKSKFGGLPGKESGSKSHRIVLNIPQNLEAGKLRMRPGDCVLLSMTCPMRDLCGECIVADAPVQDDDEELGGAVSERFVLTCDGPLNVEKIKVGAACRLDKGANRTAYERQFQALVRMATAKEEKRPRLWEMLSLTSVGGKNVDAWAAKMRERLDKQQKAALEGEAVEDVIEPDGHSREAQNRLRTMAAEEPPLVGKSDRSWALQKARKDLARERGQNKLNPSQIQAVGAAAGRRLTLIQGPPGTGKTTVSVKLLDVWTRQLRCRPVLATSDSNIAVDNIAEGCHNLGLKVVRVGRTEKITSNLEEVTLESLLKAMREDKGRYANQEGGRSQGQGMVRTLSGKGMDQESGHVVEKEMVLARTLSGKSLGKKGRDDSEEAKKRRRLEDFENKMKIMREADVICTTTIAAGSDFLSLIKFQGIVIDEVAQATELSALVPLILRGAERVVLVGDHCQLPPSVCSLEAETRGLSLSIFGRLAAQGLEPYFLDTQFRMHPMIAHFSAEEFYHGKLKCGVPAAMRTPPLGFDWPQRGTGIAFVHVGGPERREGESRSNPSEAAVVLKTLTEVLASRELSVLEVGIVSPYAAQVRELRKLLRKELPRQLPDVDLSGGLEGRRGLRALEIASVDAFQGREKELIVFSAVRSNRHGQVGFLQDWRRLNVMITRARRGLIVIGNTDTLRGDPIWGRWLAWASSEGLIVKGSGGSATYAGYDRNDLRRQPSTSDATRSDGYYSQRPYPSRDASTSSLAAVRLQTTSKSSPPPPPPALPSVDGRAESFGKAGSKGSGAEYGASRWKGHGTVDLLNSISRSSAKTTSKGTPSASLGKGAGPDGLSSRGSGTEAASSCKGSLSWPRPGDYKTSSPAGRSWATPAIDRVMDAYEPMSNGSGSNADSDGWQQDSPSRGQPQARHIRDSSSQGGTARMPGTALDGLREDDMPVRDESNGKAANDSWQHRDAAQPQPRFTSGIGQRTPWMKPNSNSESLTGPAPKVFTPSFLHSSTSPVETAGGRSPVETTGGRDNRRGSYGKGRAESFAIGMCNTHPRY